MNTVAPMFSKDLLNVPRKPTGKIETVMFANGLTTDFLDCDDSYLLDINDILSEITEEEEVEEVADHLSSFVNHVANIQPLVEMKEVEVPVYVEERVQSFCTPSVIVEKSLLAITTEGDTVPVSPMKQKDCDCEKQDVLHFNYKLDNKCEIEKVLLPLFASDTHKLRESVAILGNALKNNFKDTNSLYSSIFMNKNNTLKEFRIGHAGSGKTEFLIQSIVANKNQLCDERVLPNVMLCPMNDLCLNNSIRLKNQGIKVLYFSQQVTGNCLTLADYGLFVQGGKMYNRGEVYLRSYLGKLKQTRKRNDNLFFSLVKDFDVLVMTPSQYYSLMQSYGISVYNLYIDEAFTIGVESIIMISLFGVVKVFMSVDPYQLAPHDKAVMTYLGFCNYDVPVEIYHKLRGSLFSILIPSEEWKEERFHDSKRFPLWYQNIMTNLFYSHYDEDITWITDVQKNNFNNRLIYDFDFTDDKSVKICENLIGITDVLLDNFNLTIVPVLWDFFKQRLSSSKPFNCLVLWEKFYITNLLFFNFLNLNDLSDAVIMVPSLRLEKLYYKLYDKFFLKLDRVSKSSRKITTIRKFHGQQAKVVLVDFDLFTNPVHFGDATMLDALSRVKFEGEFVPMLAVGVPLGHFHGCKVQSLACFSKVAKALDLTITIASQDGPPILRNNSSSLSNLILVKDSLGEDLESVAEPMSRVDWFDSMVREDYASVNYEEVKRISLVFKNLVFDGVVYPEKVDFNVVVNLPTTFLDTAYYKKSVVKSFFQQWYLKTRSMADEFEEECFFNWLVMLQNEIPNPGTVLETLCKAAKMSLKIKHFKGQDNFIVKSGRRFVCVVDDSASLKAFHEIAIDLRGTEIVNWPFTLKKLLY